MKKIGIVRREIVIDKIAQCVTHQETIRDIVLSRKVCHLSSIKSIEFLDDYSYDKLNVYLVTSSYKLEVVGGGLEPTGDHRSKIAIAQKLAGFIQVPLTGICK
ncbi:MAG: hypothetical protein NZ585_07655 [Chloracidobacterium sp.]|nr:hypothetical protein [Chloracidobacterium sp.]MDW8217133.1 hypothetical protein [Acidobacteriota bacterium]